MGSAAAPRPPLLFFGLRGVPPGDLVILATARRRTLPIPWSMSPMSGRPLPAVGGPRGVAAMGTEGWIWGPSPSPVLALTMLGVDVVTSELTTRCKRQKKEEKNPAYIKQCDIKATKENEYFGLYKEVLG